MATSWETLEKPGTTLGGWMYDEVNFTYDQILDLETGDTVYYDGLGLGSVWINDTPKPSTTYTKPSKTASTWNNEIKA